MPPEDVKVTEQPAQEASQVEAEAPAEDIEDDGDRGEGFDDAFEEKKEPAPAVAGEPAKEEPEKKEGEKQEETTEEEPDEDVAMGKAILDEEKAEATARAEAEKARTERVEAAKKDQPPETPALSGLTQDIANVLLGFADPKLFEGTIKAGDVELDLAEYVRANPEVPLIAGTLMNNFIARLMAAGVIPTVDTMKEKLGAAWDRGLPSQFSDVSDRIFRTEIMARGITQDPLALISTPEFKEWHGKQKDEIRALFKSENPDHHARGLGRFLRDLKTPGVEKKTEIEKKQRETKAKKDKLFGSTLQSGKGRGGKETSGGTPDDFDSGWDEAGDAGK